MFATVCASSFSSAVYRYPDWRNGVVNPRWSGYGYRQEYKRRFARIRSGRIKPEEFYAWSKISREKRVDCETGKISLEEFSAWLKKS